MKIELKYGIIAGIAMLLWLATLFLLGFHGKHIEYQPVASSISIIIPIIFIALSMSEKKASAAGSKLTYWKLSLSGLFLALVSSLLYFAGLYLYITQINPAFLPHLAAHIRDGLLENGQSQIFAEHMTENYNYPLTYAFRSLIGSILGGFIISLVLASVYQKKKAN